MIGLYKMELNILNMYIFTKEIYIHCVLFNQLFKSIMKICTFLISFSKTDLNCLYFTKFEKYDVYNFIE